MFNFLIFLVIGLFVAMLFVNIYFRARVMKVYRRLVQNRVEFDSSHFFNKEKMRKEIYPKYPEHQEDIEIFVSHIRYSIRMATVLSALITLFGGILMYYR